LRFKNPFKVINVCEELGELLPATFIKRLNRFVGLVDVGGSIKRAHISDTGRLKELLVAGAPTLLAPNPKGKLDYKLIGVEKEGEWVLLNTSLHSKIAQRLIEEGCLGFKPKEILREVKVGGSRIDFLVDGELYLEVKGCNLAVGDVCLFPDAPTERGRRHLEELIELRRRGFRAGLLFLAFRRCSLILPNFKTDELFSQTLLKAVEAGVEVWAFNLSLGCDGWVELRSQVELPSNINKFKTNP